MREQWDRFLWAMLPYKDELRVLASIVGIVLIAALLRYIGWRLVAPFFGRIAQRAATIEERRRLQTVGRFARQALSTLIVVVAGTLVLNQLGVSIAPILGAAGVVGIAIGFGAQSLVKDVFSGFFLLVENQIRVGDVVEIAGKAGSVEELSLRRTKLRAYDGAVHYISNGLITTVTNLSTEFSYAVVDVQIPYDLDVDRAMQLMRQAAEDLRASPGCAEKMLGELEIAGIEQLQEGSIVVRARVKTAPLEQWSVRRELLRQLKIVFEREGGAGAPAAADAPAAVAAEPASAAAGTQGVRIVVGKAAHEEGAGPLRPMPTR
ncbi:MAG: mechanosensitive ion channel protein MscS [Burkholderiales bacterium]|nr:MAG: mechanosensitive ion channel protein MscS [Burkholderiales bacterium]